MPTNRVDLTETLAFEGALELGPAIALFIFLAAGAAWLVWRERRITGTWWSVLFCLLRLTAIATVLWMLMGPTHVVKRRTTAPQTVALVIDGSQSMDVIDALPTSELLRWKLAAGDSDTQTSLITKFDSAAVAVEIATTAAHDVRTAVRQHQSADRIETYGNVVRQAVTRAGHHLDNADDTLDGLDNQLAAKAQRVAAALSGRVTRALSDVTDGTQDDSLLTIDTLISELENNGRKLETLRHAIAKQLTARSSTNEKQQAPSRKECVARSLDQLERESLDSLASNVQIKRLRVDSVVTPVSKPSSWDQALSHSDSTNQTGHSTNLSAALEQLAREADSASIRAAIVWSDGAHNAPTAREPQEVAAALGNVTVHVVPIGGSERQRDLLLHRIEVPRAVVLGDAIAIDVIVTAFDCAGERSELTLRHNGREVERRPLVFASDQMDQRLQLSLPTEDYGRQEIELDVTSLTNEANTSNNVAIASVDVVRDKLRVLLADQMARWEFRYLEQLFRRDEHIEFDKLLISPQLTATGRLEKANGFPTTVADWAYYEVIILGDLDPSQLPLAAQRSLDEYVREGGGHLIVIAGGNAMPQKFAGQPLEDLLPVERGRIAIDDELGYIWRVTPEGLIHPAMLIDDSPAASSRLWTEQSQAGPMYFLSEYCRPKPAAHTLIAAVVGDSLTSVQRAADTPSETAFLCWHDAGAGRVVYLSSPTTYKLRFRRSDRLHHRFWGQLLRWITATERGLGTERVRLTTDKTQYGRGESVTVTLRITDEQGAPVRATEIGALARQADGNDNRIDLVPVQNAPGRYAGTFHNLESGAYRIEPTGAAVTKLIDDTHASQVHSLITIVAGEEIELINTRGNHALLAQVAEVTGGQILPPTAVAEVLALTSLDPDVSVETQRTPLWNRWPFLWIVTICLIIEWIARKQQGLV